MQYSFNNSRKIPKLAQFIPGIYNNFYYKILGYFWGVTERVPFQMEMRGLAIEGKTDVMEGGAIGDVSLRGPV